VGEQQEQSIRFPGSDLETSMVKLFNNSMR
jgi:hypothetical protein